MPQTVLETLAAGLLGFFTVGWSVLAGADLGLGMVLPYLARGPHERRLAVAAVVPFFLGSEVWLVAAAGVFTGCFTVLEGELFQGHAMVLIPLLAGWMLRDTGLWWHVNGQPRGGRRGGLALGDWLVTGGSWAVALSWGWLLAGLFAGTPGHVAGGFPAALTALGVAALFAAHGLAFGALRLTGGPRERARRLTVRALGPRRALAVTGLAMAVLPPAAGARLPLAESAVTEPVLGLLVPALLAVLPLLLAAQVWMWRSFTRRPWRPVPPSAGGAPASSAGSPAPVADPPPPDDSTLVLRQDRKEGDS